MPDPRKVYFGNLPLRYPERDVERIAEGAGKVRSVAVRNDEARRKAYAFVEYEDEKDADVAVKKLDGKEVDGSRISVEHYRGGRRERDERGGGGDRRGPGRRRGEGPSKTLFVGNLHENINERSLRDEFDRFGSVAEVRLGQRRAADGRQHAFVDFNELRSAEDAYNTMRNGEIRGLPIRIDYDVGYIPGSGGPERRRGGGGGGGGDRFAPYPRAGGYGRRSRSPDRRRRDDSRDRYRRDSPDRRDYRRRDDSRDRRRDDSRDRRRDDSRDRRRADSRDRRPDSRDRN